VKYLLFISFFFLLSANLVAQEENKILETGNNFYRQQQYDKAESEYRKVLESSPGNKTAKFNLANSLIRQNKTDEAQKILAELKGFENEQDLRSKSNYNEGVVFTHQKKLEQSIESYKQTLRLNPTDQQARENLQKALLELKKNQPQKKDEKKKEQPKPKQQPKPKISPRDADNQLKSLEQKEKQVQERLQKNSSKNGTSQPKDW
jgi:Ca-activated chloride channel homolog